jgi:UDP-2,3-diacylglucosamine hydrolase
MDHLFVSDVHLGAFSHEENFQIENDLISLIYFCIENNIQLHLLGDLFDYWMEYPDHHPKLGENLLSVFEKYNRDIAPITYILGNHDNWTRGYFDDIGFITKTDYAHLNLHNRHIFLHHGDGISDPDFNLKRPLVHRILRNPYFVKFYQTIFPPEAGLDLMKRFSRMSKESFKFEPELLNSWSESFLKKSEFDVVISGHDHIPRIETFSHGLYINTGTFFEHRSVVYYTNGSFKLVTWDAEGYHLKPLGSTF